MPGVIINDTQRKALREIIKHGPRARLNPSTGAALVRRGLADRHVHPLTMVHMAVGIAPPPYTYTVTRAGRAAARRET